MSAPSSRTATTITEIPFQDLGRLHDSIAGEIRAAIDDVLARSAFVGAASSASFEQAFADAHNVDHAIGVGSGTDALALALRGLGIGAGDEVIVPSMTFVATAEAVVHAGATPVIVDVDADTLLLSPEAVEAARTERTAAVMPVHLYGHVVPFDQIRAWQASGLKVIEDAAQAHLATWQGEGVGTVGDAACFSFYPGKNLGAMGDGGAVITRHSDTADRVRKLRDHGRTSKYLHDEIGWCSRLDGLQAAVLEVKLGHLAEWTNNRKALADRYRERLGTRLVGWDEGAVHHLMVIRTAAERRDDLQAALKVRGIGVGVHYPVALSEQPSVAEYARSTPNAEAAALSVLSLPMDPLMKLSEVELVCDEVTHLW
ncbi:MAG: dTDP-3-amino-3,4,6-trideoxy-alpha-D-glucose transaminase [Candidatus Aldehydirespiratoraceae bacterium]|jgi:dTDP-3-amino-3,4,6-trideoxy-alpha-D-glucose transaminase